MIRACADLTTTMFTFGRRRILIIGWEISDSVQLTEQAGEWRGIKQIAYSRLTHGRFCMDTSALRDPHDRLDEIMAIVDSLRVAVASLAISAPNQRALLSEFDAGVSTLLDIARGDACSDQYVHYLEEHAPLMRVFLGG